MLAGGVRGKATGCSFGWKHSTHRLVTEKAIARANDSLPQNLAFNFNVLKYSCVDPDFSRKNITKFVSGHFADIDNPSFKPPDALALTMIYTQKALEANSKGLIGKREDYLGYALHFLQDMLNPMHVEFRPLPKEHPERVFHKKIEDMATKIQQNVLSRVVIPKNPHSDFFKTDLPKSMRLAKKYLYLLKAGHDSNDILTQSLQNTYITTNSYMEFFIAQMSKRSDSFYLRMESEPDCLCV